MTRFAKFIRIDVDVEQGSVEEIEFYINPNHIRALGQGSLLPAGTSVSDFIDAEKGAIILDKINAIGPITALFLTEARGGTFVKGSLEETLLKLMFGDA